MKKVHLLLVVLVFATINIFSFCRSTNDNSTHEAKPKQEQINPKISKIKHVSKWDNSISRKQEGDDFGWFQTPEGNWIDTMREEKHKYNAYPPHYNNKTYFPNFTVSFPDNSYDEINVQDFFKVQVKDLEQNYVAKINPIKDSKKPKIKNLSTLKTTEISAKYLTGYTGNNESVTISLKQYGDVFISQITIWKPKPKIEEKEIETEIIVYDNQGKIIYQKNRIGSNSRLYVSKNKDYLIESGGGHINEDSLLPSFTTIYDLKNQKEFWYKKSTDNCISAGIVKGSNFAMINIIEECDFKNPNNELFSINLKSGKIFQYKSNDKAPMSKVRISEDLVLYFNTTEGKKPLSLEIDFSEVVSLP